MTGAKKLVLLQAARFLLLSGGSFLLSISLVVVLHSHCAFNDSAAFWCSTVTASFVNFFVLDSFVFAETFGRSRVTFGEFAISAITFRGVETFVFFTLSRFVGGDYRVLSAVVLVISLVAKFSWYRWRFQGR
jgi:hypothetical protein